MQNPATIVYPAPSNDVDGDYQFAVSILEGQCGIGLGRRIINNLSRELNRCLEQPSRIEDIVKQYFSHDAVIKLTLWKVEDPQPPVGTVKQYEIPSYLIGEFFRALLADSLQSFSLRLLYTGTQYLPTSPLPERPGPEGPIVECPATVCLAYANGIEVDMDGPLTVQLARRDGQDGVITSLAFDAREHKVRAAIMSGRPPVPAERDWMINAFGMPPAAMRTLDMIPIMLPVIRMMGPNGLPVAWPGGAPWHN